MATISTTPINPELCYTIQMTGLQALLLQRAIQLVTETDLATIPELLTTPRGELVEEAAILGRMFSDLSPEGLNGFAL